MGLQKHKTTGCLIALSVCLMLIAGCAASQSTPPPAALGPIEINVSAALGLREALLDIEKDYAKQSPNVKIVYNFAAAGALQAQIEQGAPADIFLSAAVKQMDALQKKNLLLKKNSKN